MVIWGYFYTLLSKLAVNYATLTAIFECKIGQKHIDIAFPLLKKVENLRNYHKLRFDKFNFFLPPKYCALAIYKKKQL